MATHAALLRGWHRARRPLRLHSQSAYRINQRWILPSFNATLRSVRWTSETPEDTPAPETPAPEAPQTIDSSSTPSKNEAAADKKDEGSKKDKKEKGKGKNKGDKKGDTEAEAGKAEATFSETFSTEDDAVSEIDAAAAAAKAAAASRAAAAVAVREQRKKKKLSAATMGDNVLKPVPTLSGKTVYPVWKREMTKKESRKKESMVFETRLQLILDEYFAARPLLSRTDRSEAAISRAWRISQAHSELRNRLFRLTEKRLKEREYLRNAALAALPLPLQADARRREVIPPPAHMRIPTLTPPVAGYKPGMGFDYVGAEEDENETRNALDNTYPDTELNYRGSRHQRRRKVRR